MNTKHYGYWLLFDEDSSVAIKENIEKLSAKYLDGSIFLPHLSIYPATLLELDKIIRKLDGKFGNVQPFEIETNGIKSQNRWSKTLFVDIKPNEELTRLNQLLHRELDKYAHETNHYSPHISLIYKENMPESEKQEAIELIQIPKTLKITSLAVVDPGVCGNNWRDFTKWQVAKVYTF